MGFLDFADHLREYPELKSLLIDASISSDYRKVQDYLNQNENVYN